LVSVVHLMEISPLQWASQRLMEWEHSEAALMRAMNGWIYAV
jgi:hypothetical protein